MTVANTQAFDDKAAIMAVKYYIKQAPGPNVIKKITEIMWVRPGAYP
jgi:hypothetical protein